MDFTNIDQQTLADNQQLLADMLRSYAPTLDTGVGTAIRELIIEPAALYYTAQAQDVSTAINSLSISTGTDETVVTAQLGNLGITQDEGSVASGYVALYLSSDDTLLVPQRVTFAAGQDVLVLTRTYTCVTDFEALGIENDGSYREIKQLDASSWYVAIPADTSAPPVGSLANGLTVTPSETLAGVTSSKIASTFSGGAAAETLDDMRARAADGITAKVPSSKSQITAMLKESSSWAVSDVSCLGMGDAEQQRWSGVYGVNPGGRVDVYARSAAYPIDVIAAVTGQCVDVANKLWRVLLTKDLAPGFYHVVRVSHTSGTTEEVSSFQFTWTGDVSNETYVPDYSDVSQLRFTKFQAAEVIFPFTPIASPVLEQEESFDFYLRAMPDVAEIQDFMASSDTRNPAGDYLVKAPIPVFVSAEVAMRYYDTETEPDEAAVQNLVADAINAAPMRRGYVSTADIAASLKNSYPEVSVMMPIILSAFTYYPDGTIGYTRSTDTLYVEEKLTALASKNDMAFFCSPGDVSLTLSRTNQFLA